MADGESWLVAGLPGTGVPAVTQALQRASLEAVGWEGVSDSPQYGEEAFLALKQRPTLLLLDADPLVCWERLGQPWTESEVPLDRLASAFAAGQERLAHLRLRSDLVLDTTFTDLPTLAGRVGQLLRRPGSPDQPAVVLESFGFPRGVPRDLNHCLDVRLLRNPFWDPELRLRSGLDPAVRRFVLEQPLAQDLLEATVECVKRLLPVLKERGRRCLRIAIGCTGGFHRSVAMAEELSVRLRQEGTSALVWHRDLPVRA